MSSGGSARALPLVYQDDTTGKFKVGDEAVRFLQQYDSEVAVSIVAGRYRSGKSFLMNKLLNTPGDFSVGHTIESHTKGIFLSNHAIDATTAEGKPIKLLLLDSEGLGAIDKGKDEHYDTTIFSLATLLCSTLIFNGASQIDEGSIQQLGFISNLTKHIRVKSGSAGGSESKAGGAAGGGPEEENAADLEPFFPQFVWVLRDFSLRLEDDDYNEITADQYLEKSLSDVQGFDQATTARNRIRKALRLFFRRRRCFPLVRPVEDEAKLQGLDEVPEDELRPEFKEGIGHLKEHIYGAALPKRLGNRSVNGPILAGLVRSYVDAINSGGVPSIADAWESAAGDQCTRLADSVIEWVDAKLRLQGSQSATTPSSGAGGPPAVAPAGDGGPAAEPAFPSLPVEESEMRGELESVRLEALRRFDDAAPSGAPIPVRRERARVVEHIAELSLDVDRANSQASRETCQALCAELRDKHLNPVVGAAREILEAAQKGQEDTVGKICRASKQLQEAQSRASGAVEDDAGAETSSSDDPATSAETLRALADAGLRSLRSQRISIGELQGRLLRCWTDLQQEYTALARGPSKYPVLLETGTPLLLESQSEVARCQAEITEAGLAVATSANDAAHAASQKLIEDVKLEQARAKALGSDLRTARTSLRKAEGEVASTKERNAGLQTELDAERKQRGDLEGRLAESTHSASLLEKRAERAMADAKDTQERLQKAHDREKEGRKAETELRSKLEEAMRGQLAAEAEVSTLKEQLKTAKERGSGLDANLSKLRRDNAEQSQRIRESDKEKEQQARSLESTHRLLQKTSAERDDLQRQLELAESQQAKSQAELEKQRAAVSDQRSGAAQLEAKASTLEETVARLEREQEEAKQATKLLEEQMAEQAKASQEEKQQLTKSLHKAKEEVDMVMRSAQEEAEQLERTSQTKLDEAATRASGLQQQVEDLQTDLASERETLKDVESKYAASIKDLESSALTLQAVKQQHEEESAQATKKLSDLELQSKQAQEDLEHRLLAVEQSEQEAKQQITALQKRLEEAQAARDQSERKEVQAAGQHSELLAASKEREKALAVELAETRVTVTSTEAQAADLREQLARERSRLEESEADRGNLRKVLEEARDKGREDARLSEARSKELETNIREATTALDTAQDLIESKKAEALALQEDKRQLVGRVDALAADLQEERQARREADQEVERVRHGREGVAAKLAEVEKDLAEAARQADRAAQELSKAKEERDAAREAGARSDRRVESLEAELRRERDEARHAAALAGDAKDRATKEAERARALAERLQKDLEASRDREDAQRAELSQSRLTAARAQGESQVLARMLQEHGSSESAAREDAHGVRIKLRELALRSAQSVRRRDETIRTLKKAQRAAKLRERRRIDVDASMETLRHGAILTKYAAHKEGEKQRRWVALAASGAEIGWCAPHRRVFTSTVRLADITGVGLGAASPVFQSAAAQPDDECCCFTLYSSERSFDFECSDRDEAVAWVFAVRCLLLERSGSGRYSLSKVVVRLEAAALTLRAVAVQRNTEPQDLLSSWRAEARQTLAPELLAAAYRKALRRVEQKRALQQEDALRRELLAARLEPPRASVGASAIATAAIAIAGQGGASPGSEKSQSGAEGSAASGAGASGTAEAAGGGGRSIRVAAPMATGSGGGTGTAGTGGASDDLPSRPLQPTPQDMQEAGAASPAPGPASPSMAPAALPAAAAVDRSVAHEGAVSGEAAPRETLSGTDASASNAAAHARTTPGIGRAADGQEGSEEEDDEEGRGKGGGRGGGSAVSLSARPATESADVAPEGAPATQENGASGAQEEIPPQQASGERISTEEPEPEAAASEAQDAESNGEHQAGGESAPSAPEVTTATYVPSEKAAGGSNAGAWETSAKAIKGIVGAPAAAASQGTHEGLSSSETGEQAVAGDVLAPDEEDGPDSDESEEQAAAGSVPHRRAPAEPVMRRTGSWLTRGRGGKPKPKQEAGLAAAVADYRRERERVAQLEADLEEEGAPGHETGPGTASASQSQAQEASWKQPPRAIGAGVTAPGDLAEDDVLAGSPLARRLDRRGRLQMHSSSEEEVGGAVASGEGEQSLRGAGRASAAAESIASDELSLAGGQAWRLRAPQGSSRMRRGEGTASGAAEMAAIREEDDLAGGAEASDPTGQSQQQFRLPGRRR